MVAELLTRPEPLYSVGCVQVYAFDGGLLVFEWLAGFDTWIGVKHGRRSDAYLTVEAAMRWVEREET